MPTLRKVPAEIGQTWVSHAAVLHAEDSYAWVERPAWLFLGSRPRSLAVPPLVGDVLRLRAAPATPLEEIVGVVLGVRVRQDGVWTHVELAVNGGVQLVSKRTVAAHLGRMKGISRIDQPTKMVKDRLHGGTHGWFVRTYARSRPHATRMFSDQRAGGVRASLKAALAFHAAHVGLNPAQAIAFR